MTTFTLPDLPYDYAAFAPAVSEITMRTHHDKHHATYVNNVNKFLADAGRSVGDLETLVRESANDAAQKKMFNNAGQAWNHGFFWHAMSADPGKPSGALAAAIERFGGLTALRSKFVDEGVGQFGSGWAWILAKHDGELEILATQNGDTAMLRDGVPILGVDVWEHAYYLDYKQDRKGYIESWFDHVANWQFAGAQFGAASGDGTPYRYPLPTS